MKEALEAKGWAQYYWCRCGGGTGYYSNSSFPRYQIRAKTQSFSIYLDKHAIAGPFYQYQLDEKLKQYVKN